MGAYGIHPPGSIKPLVAYEAETLASAATTLGAIIDTNGFQGYAVFTMSVGTFTGSGCTLAAKITESDASDASGPADVTGAAFANVTASNDEAVYSGVINLTGRERYLRVSITTSGTVTTAPVAITCQLTQPSNSAHQDVAYSFDV